jgi:hypothetical protein
MASADRELREEFRAFRTETEDRIRALEEKVAALSPPQSADDASKTDSKQPATSAKS